MCTTNGKSCNAGKTDSQLLEIITDGNPPAYYLRHLHTMLIGYLRSPIREAEPQHEMAVYDTYTTLKRLLEEMEARGDKKPLLPPSPEALKVIDAMIDEVHSDRLMTGMRDTKNDINFMDFLDSVDAELVLKRYPRQPKQWRACLEDCDIMKNKFLSSCMGSGTTTHGAVIDLLNMIKGYRIAMYAGTDRRREFDVPKNIYF